MAHLTTSDSDTLEKGSRDTSQTNDSLKEELEGGTRAWLTVAGSAAATFASFGWVNCIGLFQAEYERDLLKDYSSSQISWITSIECTSIFPQAYSESYTELIRRLLHARLCSIGRPAVRSLWSTHATSHRLRHARLWLNDAEPVIRILPSHAQSIDLFWNWILPGLHPGDDRSKSNLVLPCLFPLTIDVASNLVSQEPRRRSRPCSFGFFARRSHVSFDGAAPHPSSRLALGRAKLCLCHYRPARFRKPHDNFKPAPFDRLFQDLGWHSTSKRAKLCHFLCLLFLSLLSVSPPGPRAAC